MQSFSEKKKKKKKGKKEPNGKFDGKTNWKNTLVPTHTAKKKHERAKKHKGAHFFLEFPYNRQCYGFDDSDVTEFPASVMGVVVVFFFFFSLS